MHCVAQDHTQNCADAGDRWEPVQGLGVVLLGWLHDSPCASAPSLVIDIQQGAVACHTLGHGGIRDARGAPSTGGFRGDRLPNLGPGVLTVGIVDRCQECAAFAWQRQAAPEPITGGPHLCGIDLGLGPHAPAPEHRHVLGIDVVVFGLTAVEGLPRQGMPEDTRHRFACTQIGQPVPGKDACDTDDQSGSVGRDGCEQGLWAGGHSAVHQDRAIPGQDAAGHRARVPGDPAIKLVLLGGESQEVSSSCA